MSSNAPLTSDVTAVLTVDRAAIRHNYREISARVGPAVAAGVVKANAYGLGIEEIAPLLWREGCHTFFVHTVGEGRELRKICPTATIYVLTGVLDGTQTLFLEYNLRPVLSTPHQVKRWSELSTGPQNINPAAAIHIDTGLTRLGILPNEVAQLPVDRLHLTLLMSHLAHGDVLDAPENEQQYKSLIAVADHFLGIPRSIAASEGVFLGRPLYYADMVRVAMGLFAPPVGAPGFQQTIQLNARIIQLKTVESDTPVGYGGSYLAKAGSTLAILGMGYAEGMPRGFSNKYFKWRNEIVPIAGRISMDLMAIDITGLPGPQLNEGDWVQLLGNEYTLADFARELGTTPYELLPRFGNAWRLQKVYVG